MKQRSIRKFQALAMIFLLLMSTVTSPVMILAEGTMEHQQVVADEEAEESKLGNEEIEVQEESSEDLSESDLSPDESVSNGVEEKVETEKSNESISEDKIDIQNKQEEKQDIIDNVEKEEKQTLKTKEKHEKNQLKEVNRENDEEREVKEAVEIKENIITDVKLKQKLDDGTEQELLPGTEIIVEYPYNEFQVEILYEFALPADHSYGAGSTYTINIPDMFTVQPNPEPTELTSPDGTVFGHFILTKNGKIVITFNENIVGRKDISGHIKAESNFDKHYTGPAEGETLRFPVSGEESIDFPVKFIPSGSSIDKQGMPNKVYNTETITWTVDFNKNLNTIEDATLEDVTKGNHAFKEGSLRVFKLHINADGTIDESKTVEMENHGFGEEFPLHMGEIDSAYRVIYETEIPKTDKGEVYENDATLSGSNIDPANASATVSVKRGKPLDKKSVDYNNVSQTIKWEVKYNYDEKDIPQNKAKLKDIFGKNQEFVEGSLTVVEVEIDSKTGEEINTIEVSSDKYTVTHTDNGFDFQFNEKVDKGYKIIYQTRATERVNADGNVTNTISDEYENVIKGGQFISQGIFIKSHDGKPDYNKKETSWTILINRDEQQMKDVAFFDTLPKGFSPKNLHVTHDGIDWEEGKHYSYHYDEDSRKIEIEFNQELTKRVYITYVTEIDYDKVDSKGVKFTNKAQLEWIPENETIKITKEGTAEFDPDSFTKANGFKKGKYNPVTKEITWTIGVNYNKATLEDVVVEDFITGDQNFDINNVKVYDMILTGTANGFKKGEEIKGVDIKEIVGINDEPGFKVVLGDIATPYVIEYTTDLNEKLVDEKYDNIATVKSKNQEDNELKATVKPTHGGEYTKKNAEQDSDNPRIVHWNVNLNFTQSTVSNLSLTDTPSINQKLLKDTIKIYETTVTEKGITKNPEKLLNEGEHYTVTIEENDEGQETFTIDFIADKIDRAYVLEYDTYILYKGDGDISNEARFNAEETKDLETDHSFTQKIELSNVSGGINGEVGSLQVKKVDYDDKSVTLEGAIFELYDETGEVLLKTATTNEEGIATFKNLLYTNYILKEESAPEGYVVGIKDEQVVKVNEKITQLEVKNKKIKRHVQLKKIDGTDDIPLTGVVFQLYKDDILHSEHTTDKDGAIIVEDLEPGNYYFLEKTPQEYYQKNENKYDFSIEDKQTEIDKITVENELIPGKVTIKKVDFDHTDQPLSGAVFHIINEAKQLVDVITTDEKGEATSKDLRPGNYILKEIQAPYGYKLSSKAKDGIEFTINRSEKVETLALDTITNEVKTAKIKVVKMDAIHPSKKLAESKFKLTDEDGNEIETGITNNRGEIQFETELKPGTYYVEEIEAPEGYIKKDEKIIIEISLDDVHEGKIVTKEIKNDPFAEVILQKQDSETAYHRLAGAIFNVIDATSQEPIAGFTNLKTNQEGKISITGLPAGTYKLKEIEPPHGYKIQGDGLTESFTVSETVETTQSISVGPIHNDIVKGSVELTKIDGDTDKPLEGVEFTLEPIELKNDGTYEKTTHKTDENGHIFVDNLRPGKYKFKEVAPLPGYQPYWGTIEFEIELGPNKVVNVPNVKNYKLVDIPVTKKWNDQSNIDKRPAHIELQLYRSDNKQQPYKIEKISAEDNWSHIFTELDAVDKQGNKYEYTVQEAPIEGYKLESITGHAKDGFEIINVLTTTIEVEKYWEDDHNALKDRPSEITVELYQDEQLLKTDKIKAINDWTHEFINLPIYDVDGDKYKYTVKEKDISGYKQKNFETTDNGFKITNVRTGEKDIKVTKTWKDEENTAQRPNSISIELYQKLHDEKDFPEKSFKDKVIKPDQNGNWEHVFTDLPAFDENGKAYKYKIVEQPVPGYKSTITSNGDEVKITNVRTGLTTVEGKKTWKDDHNPDRPEEIEVMLERNDGETFTKKVTAEDDWKYSFTDLPKYDEEGIPYVYKVKENNVPKGYQSTVDGNDIINTRIGTTDIKVVKEWLDDHIADRPDEITVNLLQNGRPVDAATIYAKEGKWEYIFKDLPKYDENGKAYAYNIEEEPVKGYKTKSIETTENGDYKITNVRSEKTEIDITKEWLDTPETESRPESITVQLFQKDAEQNKLVDTVIIEPDTKDVWQHTFTDLEKYDEEGNIIKYIVKERNVPGYQPIVKAVGDKRPDHITVELFRSDNEQKAYRTAVIRATDDWKYTFDHLEMYDEEGLPYSYEVKELPVAGYKTKQEETSNGVKITNIREDKTSVEVTKQWNDNNKTDRRPEKVEVELYRSDNKNVPIKTAEINVNKDGEWKHIFTDLDAFDKDGVAYEYTVKEKSVDGYELESITGDMENGFVITNVLMTSIEVEKEWKDENSKDRPDFVVVELYRNNEYVTEAKVGALQDWKHIFENIVAFDEEGAAYTYTVKEKNIDGNYKLKGITGNAEDGFVMTNVRTGTVVVEGTKIWKDDNPQDRPGSIKINLLQNGVVVDTQVVTAEDDWTYSFTDLDKYDEEGVVYEYTVKEHDVPGYKSDVDGFDITNTRSEKKSIEVTKGWLDSESTKRPDTIIVHLLQNGEIIETVKLTKDEGWSYTFEDLEAYDKNGMAYEYTVEEQSIEGYDTIIDGFDITNLRVGKTEVSGTKTWLDDNSETRPESITVKLLQNGKEIDSQEVTADDDWEYSFTDLDEFDENGVAYKYAVEEETVKGYETIIDGYDLTNVRAGKTEVSGMKTWKDGNSKDRPESITVKLLQNDEEIDSQKVTAENNWEYIFTDLEAFDESGVAYTYSIKEESVKGYETTIDGYNLTNLRVGKTEVSGTKTWKDEDSKDRPESITVNLLQNGKKIDSQEVTSKDNWLYQFTDLEAYDENGVPYEYTVEEESVDGYETIIDGFDITNIRVGLIDVSGTKTWKNDTLADRPTSITVNLLANGKLVDSLEVTAEMNWQYNFSRLPAYDHEGKTIEYTVEEVEVPGYTSEINGFDITNTLIPIEPNEPGKHEDVNKENQKKPEEEVKTAEDNKTGTQLPKTATNMYNLIFVGTLIIVIGIVLALVRRRKINE
ncbi:MAG TPA: Cna B-type domain-containing protein [Cerasibacillus sp.]|uniref:Cna B-type domain-containing protein n=1 Tax=Cerasibacillus sp. TaxID=2498711 RepID=UPI002F3ED30C